MQPQTAVWAEEMAISPGAGGAPGPSGDRLAITELAEREGEGCSKQPSGCAPAGSGSGREKVMGGAVGVVVLTCRWTGATGESSTGQEGWILPDWKWISSA